MSKAWHDSRIKFTTPQHVMYEDKDITYFEYTTELMATFCRGYDESHTPFTFDNDYGGKSGAITAKSKYFTGDCGSYSSIKDLITLYETKWKFPQSIIEEARNLSIELLYILQSDNNPRVARKRQTGKLDMGAMHRIMKDIHTGKFSPEHTRPFKQRLKGASSRPSVAIVIEGNYRFMWNREENIPNCVVAGLALAWACQAVDCRVNVFISNSGRIHSGPRAGKAQCMNIKILAEDDSVSLHSLGVLLHRDLYRCSLSNALCHHKDIYQFQYDTNGNHQSGESGKGIDFVRKHHNADIVVAVGNHTDGARADVQISDLSSPRTVIGQAVTMLSKKLELAA